jgi:parallel beta-helix repeat protein
MRAGALVLCLGCLLMAAMAQAEVTIYVATDGNDGWSGMPPAANAAKTDGPLRTLATARDLIRAMKAGGPLTEPVRVLVRKGVYDLDEPLVLEPQDSGTEACPITYAAYPGEKPVISGGAEVTGWKKGEDGIWTAQLPRAWALRQLFVNGERRTLARSPNTGYFSMAGPDGVAQDPRTGKDIVAEKQAFRYKPDELQGTATSGTGTDFAEQLAKSSQSPEIVALFHWESGMFPISAVDTEHETIVLTGEMKWPFWADQRYFIQNAREALDAPGEWYLDRKTGTLQYKPMPGEDMSKATVIAPKLTQLVLMNGEPDAGLWVEHVRFEGLQFAYADYELEPEGHCDWQAAVTVPAVIQAVGARNCSIERCRIAHIGNYAVWLRWGCKENRAVQNEITDIGAGGVRIGEGGIAGSDAMDPRGNEVSNNFIHDIGIVYPGAIGVWIGQSSENVIAHNEICDTNYTAISCGWTWGYGPTNAHDNRIEYNHLHHIGRGVLSDMGAIYTLGTSPGTTLNHNLIHDVWCYAKGYGAGGIYPDEGSSQILIENNVVYHTISGGFTLHYGKDNTVRNNILACGRDQQVVRGRNETHIAFNFERNIVYFDTGRVWSAGGENRNWNSDYNCFWNTAGEDLEFLSDLSLEDWRGLGFDEHSIVEDPQFVDPRNGDFRLKPGSPVSKIGFEPIDISTAGLTGAKEWTDLPKRIKRAPVDFGTAAVPQPQLVSDDFEKTAVGVKAAQAVTWGEAGDATIRVTDEQAASGKHSLKFTDAPGLDFSYNPHLWYTPYLTDCVAKLQYDLRIEPGAVVGMEWRDGANPYRVGPSMNISASGELTASGKHVIDFPPNEWVHFEVTFGLGKRNTGTWDLTVTVRGQEPVRLEGLPGDPKLKRLEWLGFVSAAEEKAVFYLDNVKLER